MTPLGTVIRPGLQTTVQDRGRPGHRHLGVPLSGAADPLALALANAGVGNPPAAAGLECTLAGPTLRFERGAVLSLAGAEMEATLEGAAVPLYHAVEAHAGDTLVLGHAKAGARTYLAVRGGIAGREFLGSVSTYLPAMLGGVEGRALRAGDALEGAGLPAGAPLEVPAALRFRPSGEALLRATEGPDLRMIPAGAVERFFALPLTVDRRADRMGIRLRGLESAAGSHASSRIASGPVFPGTVQRPPDGAPFLLLADAQTTGGYPRLAQVISADLPVTGQLRPGDQVRFRRVGTDEAREITLQWAARVEALMPGLSWY